MINGTQTVLSYFDYEVLRIAHSAAFFPVFLVSLVGNILIGKIVYKKKSLKKPVNFFIVNMAMSDLVYPISMLPRDVALLFISSSWLVSGPLGHRSLHSCFISDAGSYRSRSIWNCGFSPPFPTDQFKPVPVLHSRHLGHCHGCQVPRFVLL